jgi:hypothetical protein
VNSGCTIVVVPSYPRIMLSRLLIVWMGKLVNQQKLEEKS